MELPGLRVLLGMRQKQRHTKPPGQMNKSFGEAIRGSINPSGPQAGGKFIARQTQFGRHNPFRAFLRRRDYSIFDEPAVVVEIAGHGSEMEQTDSQCRHGWRYSAANRF